MFCLRDLFSLILLWLCVCTQQRIFAGCNVNDLLVGNITQHCSKGEHTIVVTALDLNETTFISLGELDVGGIQ